MSAKNEWGDFQTPPGLAAKVASLVDRICGKPDVVIEPTAGRGAFLAAAAQLWGEGTRCRGFEINPAYVDHVNSTLGAQGVECRQGDFFALDWRARLAEHRTSKVLVLGNPPWVTHADLGRLRSRNLPPKSNLPGLRGIEARTGKANFDIAEWMLIRLIDALPESGVLAMLCKTATARRVLRHLWKQHGRAGARLFLFNAKSAFNVATDACLFLITGKAASERNAIVHTDLDLNSGESVFGMIDGELVSDISAYQRHRRLAGGTPDYAWRSGVKHDAAKIMELAREGKRWRNGLGESADLEERLAFPLLKSSDIAQGRAQSERFVLVTQSHTGEDTASIRTLAPLAWKYLVRHGAALDGRRSSIYRDRPRFSIFGIGPYSFAPWKVAVSGLHKSPRFVVVPPLKGRPVMLDDTCYFIACKSQAEARLIHELLGSGPARAFLSSLIFTDSKRPITTGVLNRVCLAALAEELGKAAEWRNHTSAPGVPARDNACAAMCFNG